MLVEKWKPTVERLTILFLFLIGYLGFKQDPITSLVFPIVMLFFMEIVGIPLLKRIKLGQN